MRARIRTQEICEKQEKNVLQEFDFLYATTQELEGTREGKKMCSKL